MRSWDTYFALFADFFSRARRLISRRVEHSGRSAVQAFPYVSAEVLQLQGSQLILLLQKAERFADDLARGVIRSRGDLLADHLLQGGE